MEQISFLHQFVKMLLNGSKWEFNSVYLRNKKKKNSFRLTGRRSASRPTAEAGLARVPACRAFRPGQQRFAGPGPRRGRSRAQTHPPSPPARPPRDARTPTARGGACSDRPRPAFKAVRARARHPTPPLYFATSLPLAPQQQQPRSMSQNRPIYKNTSTMAIRKRSHCYT